MADEYISVGKLGKPHGLSGAFRFLLHRDLKSLKQLPKHFILQSKGNYLPFFISKMELKGWNEGFINFDEITNPEQARQYTGSELFVKQKDLDVLFRKDSLSLDYLIGYKVKEEEKGEVGHITELIDNPAQVMLLVEGRNREWLIPLTDDFIVDINKKKKEILLKLPEGLLDI